MINANTALQAHQALQITNKNSLPGQSVLIICPDWQFSYQNRLLLMKYGISVLTQSEESLLTDDSRKANVGYVGGGPSGFIRNFCPFFLNIAVERPVVEGNRSWQFTERYRHQMVVTTCNPRNLWRFVYACYRQQHGCHNMQPSPTF